MWERRTVLINTFMHIRNLTICLDIYSASTLWVIDSCHVALKFCHLPLRHIFFQPVGGWLYQACLEAYSRYGDLQENKRFTEYNQACWAWKVKAIDRKWDDLTFSIAMTGSDFICQHTASHRHFVIWNVLYLIHFKGKWTIIALAGEQGLILYRLQM